jgi:signal transduction histidine kinase
MDKIGGRLIEAQEQERRRVTRELHDDICQELALLSVELTELNSSSNRSLVRTKERLEEIRH